jgi:cyclase
MQRLGANVYVETRLRGCNPGFITTQEGIVMIDTPQRPSDALNWLNEMKGKGEIRYLINTEPHGDHVIGNFFFPAIIVAHQGTRDALSSLSKEMILDKIRTLDPEGLPLMEGYFLKKPSVTFSEDLSLYLGSHTFQLIHLPGHTASETAVYIPEERVVFTSDNVFCRVQTYLHQAYPDKWIQSLKRIEELDVDLVVPGHGEVCDKSYLKEQASFIEKWVGAVRQAIRQGLSKEEAKDKISFLDHYPMDIGLGPKGPEVQRMNVERLYDYLKGI